MLRVIHREILQSEMETALNYLTLFSLRIEMYHTLMIRDFCSCEKAVSCDKIY